MKQSLKFLVLTVVIFAALCVAQPSEAPYKLAVKFQVEGDGGWDYIAQETTTNRLFIAHSTEITVVDATTGKKTGSIPADGAHGIAFAVDMGLGFSTNGRSGTVTIFDLKTLQPKKSIQVGTGPDAIIYDRYSRRIIVMNAQSRDLSVIDPQSQQVLTRVALTGQPEFAAADESHVYVNLEDIGEIAVVNSKNWALERKWKMEGCEDPSGLAIDEKTAHLFSVCGNRKMKVLSASDGRVVATLDTGSGTDGAAFDPGTGYAFASNGADGTLTVVHATSEGKYAVLANVQTQRGARTLTIDLKTHRIFLPTAEYGSLVPGQKRPPIKPGTFAVLVYELSTHPKQ